jgi:hypothetical protein
MEKENKKFTLNTVNQWGAKYIFYVVLVLFSAVMLNYMGTLNELNEIYDATSQDSYFLEQNIIDYNNDLINTQNLILESINNTNEQKYKEMYNKGVEDTISQMSYILQKEKLVTITSINKTYNLIDYRDCNLIN